MRNYFKPFFNKSQLLPPIVVPPAVIEATDVSTIHDTSESYIHLPVEIDLRSLQDKLNREIRNGTKVIDMPDYWGIGAGTGVSSVRVYKVSDLIIAAVGGMLHITIHIKVEAKVRHGSSYMGNHDYEVSGSAKIKMISSLLLSDNLELNPSSTKLEIEKIIDWGAQSSTQPVAPVQSQPANDWWTYLMGGATSVLNYTKDSAASIFSSAGKMAVAPIFNSVIIPKYLNVYIFGYIAENYCSKQAVVRRLYDVCGAKEVNTDYHIWYAIQPRTIYTNQPVITAGKIKVSLEMHAEFETSIGQKPHLRFNGDLIRVESRSTVPVGDFKASFPISMAYLGITNIVQHKLLGRYITADGLEDKDGLDGAPVSPVGRPRSIRQKITKKIAEKVVGSSCINGVRVSKGLGSLIMIELKLKGSFNGNYKLALSPLYDAQKEEIYFDDYKLDQRGIIMDHRFDIRGSALKIADVFLHDDILKLVKRHLVIPLRSDMDQTLNLVNDYLKNDPVIKNMAELEVTSLSVSKINLTNAEMVVLVAARGKAAIRLRPDSA